MPRGWRYEIASLFSEIKGRWVCRKRKTVKNLDGLAIIEDRIFTSSNRTLGCDQTNTWPLFSNPFGGNAPNWGNANIPLRKYLAGATQTLAEFHYCAARKAVTWRICSGVRFFEVSCMISLAREFEAKFWSWSSR